MIFDSIDFNDQFDIMEVDQFGFVDLRLSLETHTVPGNLNPDDLSFNEIDDPRSITGKPSDMFQALQQGLIMKGYAESSVGESPDKGDSK